MIRRVWEKHQHVIAYLFFGALTTAVNYAVYLPCYNCLGLSAAVSNILAWIVAVIVAYVTNKPFVFHDKDWSVGHILSTLGKFVGCRVGSGVLETAFLFLTVDVLHWSGNWMKLIVAVAVVILNYFGSKLLVFRK